MNWLVIAFFAILAGNIYQGYKKGFLRIALSLVSWIVVVVAANAFAPQMTELLISQTTIDETIMQTIQQAVTETVENINIEQQLPPELNKLLLDRNISFEELFQANMIETEKLLPYISSILQILCTIILLIALKIILFIIDKVFALATNLPLIGQADKFLGLALGLIKGILLTWILMTMITFGAMINGDFSIITTIHESQILTWLYENNIVLNFIMNL